MAEGVQAGCFLESSPRGTTKRHSEAFRLLARWLVRAYLADRKLEAENPPYSIAKATRRLKRSEHGTRDPREGK